MDLFKLLESFTDMLIIVKDDDGNILYPSGSRIHEYIGKFKETGPNTFYSAEDKKWYQLDAARSPEHNYTVYRYLDITKHQTLVNSYEQDACTGLYIRRKLLDNFHAYLDEALREKQEFAIVMSDIDFFKRVNDTYGHQAGDRILNNGAQMIKTNIRQDEGDSHKSRPADIVGRFGGEEFMFVLKNISRDNALKRVDQIRKKIADMQTRYVYPNDGVEVEIPITISFGVSHVDPKTFDEGMVDSHYVEQMGEQFIKDADGMLYYSKTNGRNKVSISEFSGVSSEKKENYPRVLVKQ